MIKTLQIDPDRIAISLAEQIADKDNLVSEFNGDFYFINWDKTTKVIQEIIRSYFK
jgi:hypothetical protein